jgi:hypothetical protein
MCGYYALSKNFCQLNHDVTQVLVPTLMCHHLQRTRHKDQELLTYLRFWELKGAVVLYNTKTLG